MPNDAHAAEGRLVEQLNESDVTPEMLEHGLRELLAFPILVSDSK